MKSTRIPLVLLQVCLCFVFTLGQQTSDVCVLLKNCPGLLNFNQAAIKKKICGYEDDRYPKVWCTINCITPDSEEGTCILATECKPFNDIYRNSDPYDLEIRERLHKFVCRNISTVRKPYVCCPSKPIPQKNSTPSPVDPPKKTGASVFANQRCGIASDQYKVVGGQVADLGEHPWLALLEYTKRNGKNAFLCGGTLISIRYVLTAAHCVNERAGKLLNVVLGEHNTSSPVDCIGSSCAPPPQTIKIEKALRHQEWDNADSQFYDDIALLRLQRDVVFTDTIQPICLPPPEYKPSPSVKMIVAGWGRTENKSASDVKRVATLYLQDSKTCLNTVPIPLAKKQLCVGGGKADSCSGDSGGPLMTSTEDGEGVSTWNLVGVVSLGYNAPCGSTGRPGVYTAVSHYLDWIQKNTY